MVATIDGKTISGKRGEDVQDLGSKIDHVLMRRIEDQADGLIVGATTIRAADPKWDPGTDFRIVVSNSGRLDYSVPYFQTGKHSYVACSESAPAHPESPVDRLEAGGQDLDFQILFKKLAVLGCKRLLCMGGSDLNGQLLRLDLVDELFLTIAPKVKLGESLPTYAGGEPLKREDMLDFSLVEHHAVGDELFLRYRRKERA